MNLENFKSLSEQTRNQYLQIEKLITSVVTEAKALIPNERDAIFSLAKDIMLSIGEKGNLIKTLAAFEKFEQEFLMYLGDTSVEAFKKARKECKVLYETKRSLKQTLENMSEEEKEIAKSIASGLNTPAIENPKEAKEKTTEENNTVPAEKISMKESIQESGEQPKENETSVDLEDLLVEDEADHNDTKKESDSSLPTIKTRTSAAYNVSTSIMIDPTLTDALGSVLSVDFLVIGTNKEEAIENAKKKILEKIMINIDAISTP